MTESADREGMFSDPRPSRDFGSVVTCTRCGVIVVDTDAHRQIHNTSLWSDLAGRKIQPRQDRVTSTEHDAALYEHRRGQADDS